MYFEKLLNFNVWKTVAEVLNPFGSYRNVLTDEQKRRVVSVGKNINIDQKIKEAQLWALARESSDAELLKMQAAIKVVIKERIKEN